MNAIILSVWIDGDLSDEEAEKLLLDMRLALPDEIDRRVFDDTYRREETDG